MYSEGDPDYFFAFAKIYDKETIVSIGEQGIPESQKHGCFSCRGLGNKGVFIVISELP